MNRSMRENIFTMIDTMISHKFAAALAALMLCVVFASDASAARPSDTVDTSGRFRIEAGGLAGVGFDRKWLANDTNGEPVLISGGGGVGLLLTLGYGLSKRFDIDFTAAKQTTVNKHTVIDGDAEFERKYLLATLKYKLPYSSGLDLFDGQVKLGAGVGYYYSSNLTFNVENLYTGETSSYSIDYMPALGYHLTAEFEAFMPNDWSVTLGTKLYQVTYEADDETYSGFYFDSTYDSMTDLEGLNGRGIDFMLTLGKYFW